MSTELQRLAGGELSADIIAKLQETTQHERERIGPAGGDFIRVNNNKRVFAMPNEQEVEEFEAHIIDFAYYNEYFMGAYNPKKITPPACFAVAPSTAQLTPSDNSPMNQNPEGNCSTCQQNQFGTSATGDGKACKNTVVLALLPPDDIESHDIWLLKTSPTAIKPFNKYASKISQMNIPLGVVRTRIFLDPDSTYASVRFEALGVDQENIDAALSRKDEAAARLAEEPDVSQFEMPTADK
jgi:hypothetical protein